MQLKINGTVHEYELEPATLSKLLEILDIGSVSGTAVAVNDRVVPRSTWADHRLNEGDRIEVIRATQGG